MATKEYRCKDFEGCPETNCPAFSPHSHEPDALILNSELALLGLILVYGFWTWLKGR
ncbi:hypothetical protein LCGC14_2260800 [marine sediment metagenome]|uniref:Uncharacterized protein n=1 Tax=marine sediment metagenome TaxID=412755 RepID=A0A0F9FUT4_9ZZZZ